jgi:hypothetical protein
VILIALRGVNCKGWIVLTFNKKEVCFGRGCGDGGCGRSWRGEDLIFRNGIGESKCQ